MDATLSKSWWVFAEYGFGLLVTLQQNGWVSIALTREGVVVTVAASEVRVSAMTASTLQTDLDRVLKALGIALLVKARTLGVIPREVKP